MPPGADVIGKQTLVEGDDLLHALAEVLSSATASKPLATEPGEAPDSTCSSSVGSRPSSQPSSCEAALQQLRIAAGQPRAPEPLGVILRSLECLMAPTQSQGGLTQALSGAAQAGSAHLESLEAQIGRQQREISRLQAELQVRGCGEPSGGGGALLGMSEWAAPRNIRGCFYDAAGWTAGASLI